MALQPFRDDKRVVAMALHRSGNVSVPVMTRNAFIGASEGPRSRSESTRQAMA